MRKEALLAAVLGVAAGCTRAAPERPAAQRAPGAPLRSLWVWRTQPPATLVDFALTNGIQRLYYAVSSPLTDAELLQDEVLISLAHANGLQVLALGGKPAWGTARGISDAIAWENEVLSSGASFDGIALDIEPADATDDGGGQAFVAAVEAIRASAPNVDLEMAQRDGWGTRRYGDDGYATLAEALDATGINEVEIMSYRDNDAGGARNPNNQFGVALADMEAAYAAGIRATLGAETSNIRPSELTFSRIGYDGMQAVLSQTDALEAAAGFTNYRGISIECYAAYQKLAGAARQDVGESDSRSTANSSVMADHHSLPSTARRNG